ncbi:MAG TPA: CHAT domain-containing protein, partial [Rhizomicrobium sp.]
MPDQVAAFLSAARAAGLSGADGAQVDQEMYLASQLIESGVEGQTIARMAVRQTVADATLKKELDGAEKAERSLASLRLTLATLRATPDEDRDPGREKILVANLGTAREQDEAAQAGLQKDFPQYARLTNPGPVSLDELRNHLRPREGFVSFVIGVHTSFVLLVTRDGLTVRPIDTTQDSLAGDIADLRSVFSSLPGLEQPFSLKNAYALYGQLLGPVDKELSGLDRLAVSANGDLASLPFALLVTANPQESRSYNDAAWLVRRVAITQISSPRAFVVLRNAQQLPTPRP